ncbi:Y-family DNA polymerase [Pedobacter nutrimenti]|uniref:DNA polymerase V n=1 Tax=Pedobacter nutrimenti TaxID=1241337 RepID=A0A318UKB8_9SPHI|nr:Y-family DNA polymerase [Pedobacter nutrimenti]PYF68478.1 DNA polymerase V [Pedobacter nutrimenti]
MIAIADCNNFYASCQRLFNPALIDKPVVVLSNNDGCVVARSNEAKALGIAMGVPAFQIKDLIEEKQVHVFSSNYTLYGDMSNRVMTTLSRFSPNVEIYSIDEAFLLFDGFDHYNLSDYARIIVQTTTKNTGIPISIGIAPTKTLAKLANKIAKKDPIKFQGVMALMNRDEIRAALLDFPVQDVWGIGNRYAMMLNQYGIKTALQFVNLPPDWVKTKMTITGLRMWHELRGKPCIPMEENPPSKKGICTSRSFGKMLNDYEPIAEAVANYSARCAMKLRAQNSSCKVITVFLNTNGFRTDLKQYNNSKSIVLPVATNSSFELNKFALQALCYIFKSGYSYKKAGVMVTDIVPQSQSQKNLFYQIDDQKQNKIMQALDKINALYGSDKLRFGAQGFARQWRLKNEMLSPCYTTRLNELIRIKL